MNTPGTGAAAPKVAGPLPPNPLSSVLGGGADTELTPPPIPTKPAPAAPYVFHATPAELVPGDPRRVAALDTIAHGISKSVDATPFVKQLQTMNVTPDEQAYVSNRLKALRVANDNAQLHDLTHTVLPGIANAGLGLVGTDTHNVAYALEHPVARLEGKGPFAVKSGAVMGGNDFPFMGGAEKAAAEVGDALNAGRTADEAAQHVSEAARAARAEGHGLTGARTARNVPLVSKGETTPLTGGEVGSEVRGLLKGAGKTRGVQEDARSEERSLRASAAEKAMQIGGEAGYHEALRQLQGELPKEFFGNFKNLSQAQLDQMYSHVLQHPELRPFEKVRAAGAIEKATNGVVPTRSEQTLLERAFGREASDQLVGSLSTRTKASRIAAEVLNVPRSLMASFDLSAPFRQGLVVGVRYPRTFFANFGPMLKSAGSEKFFQGVMGGIYDRPTYPLMQKAGLAITDIGADATHGSRLENREEQFMSNLAERLPGIGKIIRGSDRAYIGFLNKTRADVFDRLVQNAAQQGLDVNDEKLLQSIGRFVNSATGRGDLGALQKHAVTLNTLFFSPRLLASRLNFMNPLYYAKLDPFARREALKSAASLVGSMFVVLEIAKAAGADVNMDPRNADFGKIRIGDTRIDLAGGFQQPVRLMAQLLTGTVISSTTGKTLHLGPEGPGNLSRFDIAQRFVESKLAPVPSITEDLLRDKNSLGGKLNPESEVVSHVTPLMLQDWYSLLNDGGLAASFGGGALSGIGVGIQTYGSKKSSGSSGSNGVKTLPPNPVRAGDSVWGVPAVPALPPNPLKLGG